MKLTKLLFFCLAIIFFACDDNDDPKPNNDETFVDEDGDGIDDTIASDPASVLVGEWDLTAYDYTGESTTNVAGIETTATYVGEGTNIDYTATFGENPNTISLSGSYDIILKTTIAGQTSTTTTPVSGLTNSGTWTLNDDNTISFETSSGDPEVYTIEKFSSSTLVLSLSVQTSEDYSQSGIEYSATSDTDTVLTFTKK